MIAIESSPIDSMNFFSCALISNDFNAKPPKSQNTCVNLWFSFQMDLRVSEIFLSIQGESSHAGRPCSFVRLTGCPMRCVWCDSEYTFTGGEHINFESIFEALDGFGCNLVEVTGGEPLAQKNVFPFITLL